ncbi:MAG: flagellar hook-length control protein FliK [Desulfovibrio sp.]|jgi:flagellar hook-length control protein FliK|nr:flagellar hook-length control protein FliK [Desulfovibrio sp.]
MQIFPSAGITAIGFAVDAVADTLSDETQAAAQGAAGADFDAVLRSAVEDAGGDDTVASTTAGDSVLRSFIEEGRTDYSGRPAGFAAYDESPSAVNGSFCSFVKEELHRRGVPETSSERLDALAASGRPLTVTAVFNALTGRSRASAALTEDEGNTLKGLLTKLGIDPDEQASLLAMSDAGNVNGVWKRISAALAGHNNELGISGEEFAVLLKGLDLSSDTIKALSRRFAEQESAGFTGASLRELLAPAEKELADRALASQSAAREMRAAVDEAMRRAKAGERSEPVDDKRGNRFSEQSEALMQDSVRRRTGTDDVADAGRDDGKNAEDNGESAENRGNREGRPDDLSRFNREKSPQNTQGTQNTQTTQRAANDGVAEKRSASEVFVNALATGGQTASAGNTQTTARAERYSSEIFSQVESGLLQGIRNGAQRLTLQLNPEDLGAVTVILSFHQGELRAGIRAERAESAEILARQLAELKAGLEEQGIKVAELDVRASIADNGSAGTWAGQEEHNLLRDAGERDRLLRLARLRREEAPADAISTISARYRENGGGLHLVA